MQTPVRFFSEDEPITIVVRTRETDRFVAKCVTPCSMDLDTGDYTVKALATETSPRAVMPLRLVGPRDVRVRPGSKDGEGAGLALAVPSTFLLPIVTIYTVYACWPTESPNRDAWCAKGYGGWTILGLIGTTTAGWVLYHSSHTKFDVQPTTTNAPIFGANKNGATFGWSFSF